MSVSIRNAFFRSLFAAVLTTATIAGIDARAEHPGAKSEEPTEGADVVKEAPLLEVLSFEQISMLPPEARRQYMDGLRELVTDLSISDAGSEYEFFGGSDVQTTYGALDGWRGGYYVLNRAFVNAANAQSGKSNAEDELQMTAEQRAKKRTLDSYLAARARVLEKWTPDKTFTIKGGEQKVSKGWFGGVYSLSEWNAGREKALEDLKKQYKEGYTYSKIDDIEKISEKPKPYTMPEVKRLAEEAKKPKGSAGDLYTTCPSPEVKCSKRSKDEIKNMAEVRKDKCIYGGIVSNHEGSENLPNRKPGRCKRPADPMMFGSLKVTCKDQGKNVILCNPVLFDTIEPYMPGMTTMKGLCVPASQSATVDCEVKSKAKFAKEEDLKKKNMPMGKRFWENDQIPGIAEEVNKVAKVVNETCLDSRVKQAQCRECGTIQRNLSKTNLYAKNCKPPETPLPPRRPVEFGGKPAGQTQGTSR